MSFEAEISQRGFLLLSSLPLSAIYLDSHPCAFSVSPYQHQLLPCSPEMQRNDLSEVERGLLAWVGTILLCSIWLFLQGGVW